VELSAIAATGSKVIDKITMNYESNFENSTSTHAPKLYTSPAPLQRRKFFNKPKPKGF